LWQKWSGGVIFNLVICFLGNVVLVATFLLGEIVIIDCQYFLRYDLWDIVVPYESQ